MVDNERPVETYGAIKTTELSVTPRRVKPGEEITIKAKFRNTSHWFTSYTILFKFSGETIKKFTGWEAPGGLSPRNTHIRFQKTHLREIMM